MPGIYKVTEVDVQYVGSDSPRTLWILAYGLTSSSGWRSPRLEKQNDSAPTDGVYAFQFNADPPAGIATQVVSRIAAVYCWPNPPSDLTGVRVHSRTNQVEKRLSPGASVCEGARILGLDSAETSRGFAEVPFPWQMLGFDAGSKQSVAPSDDPHVPIVLEGDLKGGIVQIGGDTTGWELRGVGFEVDITQAEGAKALNGKRVRAEGVFELRHYVERGYIWTFRLTGIGPA